MFRLGIELGNAAMSTPADVADALEKAAARIRDCDGWAGVAEAGNIRDENGNTVGTWDVEIGGLPGGGLAGEGED